MISTSLYQLNDYIRNTSRKIDCVVRIGAQLLQSVTKLLYILYYQLDVDHDVTVTMTEYVMKAQKWLEYEAIRDMLLAMVFNWKPIQIQNAQLFYLICTILKHMK
eukprot:94275_1